jgi:hypothetical protein
MMLCTWLIELVIDKGIRLAYEAESELPENASALLKQQKQNATIAYQAWQTSFNDFLNEYKEDLDTEAIFQLLQNHGRLADCIKFAAQKVHWVS